LEDRLIRRIVPSQSNAAFWNTDIEGHTRIKLQQIQLVRWNGGIFTAIGGWHQPPIGRYPLTATGTPTRTIEPSPHSGRFAPRTPAFIYADLFHGMRMHITQHLEHYQPKNQFFVMIKKSALLSLVRNEKRKGPPCKGEGLSQKNIKLFLV